MKIYLINKIQEFEIVLMPEKIEDQIYYQESKNRIIIQKIR